LSRLWHRQSGAFGEGLLKGGSGEGAAMAIPETPAPYSEERRPLESIRAWERR
jgi:hypothetical protein